MIKYNEYLRISIRDCYFFPKNIELEVTTDNEKTYALINGRWIDITECIDCIVELAEWRNIKIDEILND